VEETVNNPQTCPKCADTLQSAAVFPQFLDYFPDGGVICWSCRVIYDPADFEELCGLSDSAAKEDYTGKLSI